MAETERLVALELLGHEQHGTCRQSRVSQCTGMQTRNTNSPGTSSVSVSFRMPRLHLSGRDFSSSTSVDSGLALALARDTVEASPRPRNLAHLAGLRGASSESRTSSGALSVTGSCFSSSTAMSGNAAAQTPGSGVAAVRGAAVFAREAAHRVRRSGLTGCAGVSSQVDEEAAHRLTRRQLW